MIALAAKFNNHDLQASSAAPGKTWFHSFTKGLTESVIEGNFLESTIKKSKMVHVFKFSLNIGLSYLANVNAVKPKPE